MPSLDKKADQKMDAPCNSRQNQTGILNPEVVKKMKESRAAMGFAVDVQPNTELLWMCSVCGKTWKSGKFCMECGAPKPKEYEGWECSCGHRGRGDFCSECGLPKPADVCDQCGWKPAAGSAVSAFCPECGFVIQKIRSKNTKIPDYYWE